MFTLFLSKEDRAAIDWVGDRYNHGHQLYDAITDGQVVMCVGDDDDVDNADWSYDGDLEYELDQETAERVCRIVNNSNLDCFAPSLVRTLRDFCQEVYEA